jgi:hypothetical protein
MDAFDKAISIILGKNSEVNDKNARKFKTHLLKNLKLPLRVTGTEMFPWEERYVFGGLDKEKYEKLKKDNPSFSDEFDLFDIHDPVENDDILAKIKRVSDGKIFDFELSWLEAVDKKSKAFTLLDDYSTWHANC